MAHGNRLNALTVKRAKKPGMLPDGRGLYLRIGSGAARSWLLRYKRGGRSRYLGLGSAYTITLAQARERAAVARRLLIDGIDPIEAKRKRQGGSAN